ncbi:MAG: SDR family NAD(P)-dependent oxidoreductase, partial [Chloroflexi bacterium]|nr:SDR family NAD(P)-dependent oxidoreductase [Chloroflexota bacterium]
MEQLEGKVAVVTGGGSGIGEGIARACADAGMRLVIADIEVDAAERVASSLRETGGDAIALRTDVTDRD